MRKWFHVMSNPRLGVKEITERKYLKALTMEGWLVGYVDPNFLLLHKHKAQSTIWLTMRQLTDILCLQETTV